MTGRIVKPDWLQQAIPRINISLRLYKENRVPESIEAFMIVTPLKCALRGVYGKDNRGVAWALLKEAWVEYFKMRWLDFRYKIGWLDEDMRDALQDIQEVEGRKS